MPRKKKDACSGGCEPGKAGLSGAARDKNIFATAEEFSDAANAYFSRCDADGELYGEAGLCLALSQGNRERRAVTLSTLRRWYDGEECPWLQEAVELAYLRIQSQIETDPRYGASGGMATRAIFLHKQPRYGGYTDKQEQRTEATVKVVFGGTMDKSDFA